MTPVLWYRCGTCGVAFQVGAILSTEHWAAKDHRAWISCIACGSPAPYVMDGEEQWWNAMEVEHGFSRPVLKMLMTEFSAQRTMNKFGLWLEYYLRELEKDGDSGT